MKSEPQFSNKESYSRTFYYIHEFFLLFRLVSYIMLLFNLLIFVYSKLKKVHFIKFKDMSKMVQ